MGLESLPFQLDAVTIFVAFSRPCLLCRFFAEFGCLLAPFWLPLAHFWLPFRSLWLPLGPFWLTFGVPWLTFGALSFTFAHPGINFLTLAVSCRHFSYIFEFFGDRYWVRGSLLGVFGKFQNHPNRSAIFPKLISHIGIAKTITPLPPKKTTKI